MSQIQSITGMPSLTLARLLRAVPSAARLLRFGLVPREQDVRAVIDINGRMAWEWVR